MQKKHRKILEPNCCEALDNAKVHQHSTNSGHFHEFFKGLTAGIMVKILPDFWLIAGFLLARNSKSIFFSCLAAWFIVKYVVYSHLSWFIGVFFRWFFLQHFSFRTEKLREQGTVYFCFCSWTKNRNKLTWLNMYIYIYTYKTIANITCFFFFAVFFVTFFFFPTGDQQSGFA